MALNTVKEVTANALKLGPSNLHTASSPPRRMSSHATAGAGVAPKPRILAMLDNELEGSTSSSPLSKGRWRRVREPAKDPVSVATKVPAGDLLIPVATGLLIESSTVTGSSTGFFTENRALVPAIKTKPHVSSTVSKPPKQPARRLYRGIGTPSVVTTNDAPINYYSYEDYQPSPAVVYTNHEEEANDLVQSLKGPLGFDLEWPVLMQWGATERRTAVVQLSDAKMILVIQISSMQKFPQKVKDVIESPDIVKTGANIANDGRKLFRDFGILPENLVELGAMAQATDPEFSKKYKRSIVALATMVQMYTGKELDKASEVRGGNWEKVPLSATQIRYAANDVHCSLMVYNRLLEIAAASERILEPTKYSISLNDAYEAGKLHPKPAKSVIRQSTESSIASQSSTTPTQLQAWISDQVDSSNTPRPQHMRAYNLWHNREVPLDDIRTALRSKENPLAAGTVISYVIWALQADPSLPFSMPRLKELVQLEAGSWVRHRDWILLKDAELRSATETQN